MKYIETKVIEAEPCSAREDTEQHKKGEPGYKVHYTDGSEYWVSREVFLKAYLPLNINEKAETDNPSISQQMVDDFIVDTEVMTAGDKTTIVRAILQNGFELVESSSCVSPENYDEELGAKICMGKIKDKVWSLLGFLLQTAVNGTGAL